MGRFQRFARTGRPAATTDETDDEAVLSHLSDAANSDRHVRVRIVTIADGTLLTVRRVEASVARLRAAGRIALGTAPGGAVIAQIRGGNHG